jgi:hypothetical protein
MPKKSRKGQKSQKSEGRSKYQTYVLPRLVEIEGWARDGLTEEQIAKNLGVAYSTFRVYKDKYPALSAALKRSKAIADREVENALFKRAIGYTYEEITQKPLVDPETGETRIVVTKVVTKHVLPNVTAQIFWLKNRKPEEWRDRKETEITGKDGGPVELKSWVDLVVKAHEGEADPPESPA